MCPRFSEHFDLNKSQAELDFVDIELDRDLALFVDPYALSIYPGKWYEDCNSLVIDFFSLLLSRIKDGQISEAFEMLSRLREPNDTRLGLSKGAPNGRGIGQKYAHSLYTRFLASRAVQTGKLSDISDCELMIEGISSDRISDMTINIIRQKLIEYTQSQCKLWNVPMQQVPSGICWDSEEKGWVNSYTDLPVYEDSTIVLVPKNAVRYRSIIDHQKYYRGYVLNFLQAEHLSANSSLVQVLKNKKRVVRKKVLEKRFPLKKDFIADFAEKHPRTLENYKADVKAGDRMLPPEGIEALQEQPRVIAYDEIRVALRNILPGREGADEFHNLILGALDCIFSPDLMNPTKEEHVHNGRKRIDIVFDNCCNWGFFRNLKMQYDISCPFIFVECKNYSSDLNNPEFDQLTGRFSHRRGQFGLLVCRDKGDSERCLSRCKDALNDDRGCVIVLDDNDIDNLLEFKIMNEKDRIDKYMSDIMRQLVM